MKLPANLIRPVLGLACIASSFAIQNPMQWTRFHSVAYAHGAGETESPAQPGERTLHNYDALPLSFEANKGQVDSQVDFVSRGSGYNVYLSSIQAVMEFPHPRPGRKHTDLPTFPTTTDGALVPVGDDNSRDPFIAILNNTGSALTYSTYIGTKNFDTANAVAVDELGSVYLVGTTSSLEFATTAGSFQQTKPGHCRKLETYPSTHEIADCGSQITECRIATCDW